MTCWASSETFVGSAGILPAAAGMLPAVFFSCRGAAIPIRFQPYLRLSGRMPGMAGNMPALPFTF
jgi:hypothetical protein